MIHRTPKFLIHRYPQITWLTDKKRLFTFDDGPGKYSIKIAELLKSHNEQAIFFILGKTFDHAICKEIMSLGHDIGWHSHTHSNFIKLSIDEIKYELQQSKSVEDKLDYKMTYFRFPYGYFRKRFLPLVEESGFKSMLWSFKCDDYKKRSETELFRSMRNIRVHDIILLHDRSDNTQNTYHALKKYLEEFSC